MKKVLFIAIIMVTFFLVGCSSFKWTIFVASDESVDINSPSVSESNQESRQSNATKSNSKTSNEYKKFDSYGYNVEADDLYVLAEVLYASDELYGSYRLFDAIGINIKEWDNRLQFRKYREQWTKIKCGLNVYVDYSENPDRYYYLLENQIPGTYSAIPLGSRGPAGGYVFYDKGFYSDGWRYLEAAPGDLYELRWGEGGSLGTLEGIGTGEKNTERIASRNTSSDNAAIACLNYSNNGYDDWFLPSKYELNMMYTNLCGIVLDAFVYDFYAGYGCYWSSSEGDSNHAWGQNFNSGGTDYYGYGGPYRRDYTARVRPVRAF